MTDLQKCVFLCDTVKKTVMTNLQKCENVFLQADDFVDVQQNTNPIIAAVCTAHARLKLYSYIERLGENCLYFDTGTYERLGENCL